MTQMDARIILAGQQPNFLNTLATANQAAAQQKGFQRTDQLNAFLQENGAGIVRGDQNALAGYGQFDPKAAVGIQATQQGMRIDEEELKLRRQQAARQAEEHVANMSAFEREQEAEKTKQGLMAAGRAFDAGNEAEFNRILQQNGVEPFPMSEFPYRAAEYAGVLDALEKANQYGKPPAPAWEVKDGVYYDKNNPGAGAKPVQGMQGGGIDPEGESKLRKEFVGLAPVKAFSEQANAYGRIVASAKDASPAGDLAMIFNFMKVLDPGSVVRESEFATAEAASRWMQHSEQAGMEVPQPIASAIRKMATGQRLSDEQRRDFLSRAGRIYTQSAEQHRQLEGQYSQTAESYGYDGARTIPDFAYRAEGAPPFSARPKMAPGRTVTQSAQAAPETQPQPVEIPPQAPERFSALPQVQDALKDADGITPQDIWENLSPDAKQRIMREMTDG